MINTTDDLIFVCLDKEVRPLIIKAAKLTEKIIFDFEGVKSVTIEQAERENAREIVRFSFIQYFGDIENNPNLSKSWLNSLFLTVTRRTIAERNKLLPSFFTESAKLLPQQKSKIGKLCTHLHLFFHNIWCLKIALLPTSYSRLPKEKIKHPEKKINSKGIIITIDVPIGEEFYPEFLKLARSPLLKKNYDSKVNDQLPESSYDNINWYAHRVVRAMDVWDLQDLKLSHILDFSKTNKSELGFAKNTIWLAAIVDVHQDLLGFDSRKIASTRFSNSNCDPEDWLTTTEKQINPHHMKWEGYFSKYREELINAGYTNALKTPVNLRSIILAPLLSEKLPFPDILEYKREHLSISKTHMQNKGLKNTTLDRYLRDMESFLMWLESTIPEFKSPFLAKVDLPKSRRPSGTTKPLLPEGSFPVALSYNYGICEFIKYVNYEMRSEARRVLISTTHTKIVINTEACGFVPIFFCNGVIRTIKEIPSILLAPIRTSTRIREFGSLKDSVIYPHAPHITAVLMETGIRKIHLRWLDVHSYNSTSLERNSLYPRGYGINRIHVNTDKSHGAWDAKVSDSVLDILEEQFKFRETYLNGVDTPRWYNNIKNSPFGKVTPLFACASQALTKVDSFPVVSDSAISDYFKRLIRSLSYELLKNNDTRHLAICSNTNQLSLLEFVNDNTVKVKQTPHSCRSQVVSDKITMLAPSVIKEMTGHTDEAHVIYYAQIKDSVINTYQRASGNQFLSEIENAIINVQSDESPIKKALRGNNLGDVLINFGAFSFDDVTNSTEILSGITKMKELSCESSLISEIHFDTTHICPFNNSCPNEIKKRFYGKKRCGECPYSIKTIDHLPAIGMKLRKYTDKLTEVQSILDEAKRRNESPANLKDEIEEKQLYANEIAAWSASHSLLSKMEKDLSKKEKWLIEKPEIISKRLSQCKASNELTLTLLKINDAEQSAAYMTPSLKAKVSKLRKQLLVSTKNYEKLLIEPEGYLLLSEFKGIISSICQLSGISPVELGDKLNQLPNGHNLALEIK